MGNKIPYFLQRKIYRRNKGQRNRLVDQWFWSGIYGSSFTRQTRKFKEAAIQQEQLLESALYHFQTFIMM